MARVQSYSDNDEIVVLVEMPGLDPQSDVRIEIHDRALEIAVAHVENGRTERASHLVALPQPVSETDLDVSCDGDVLRVRVPRRAARPVQ